MADRAQVSSIEAIAAFRANLLVYMSKARSALDEVDQAKINTGSWLRDNRRNHWESELRRRRRILEEREQELFSAKLSSLRTATAAQSLAVERAKLAVREAEEKCVAVRKWTREYDLLVEPLVKELTPLHTFLANDLPKAIAHLDHLLRSLEAYATAGSNVTKRAVPLAQANGTSDSETHAGAAADLSETGQPAGMPKGVASSDDPDPS